MRRLAACSLSTIPHRHNDHDDDDDGDGDAMPECRKGVEVPTHTMPTPTTAHPHAHQRVALAEHIRIAPTTTPHFQPPLAADTLTLRFRNV